MIVIKLQGGLGNQMFQYAFGRKIELLLNEKVLFDLSFNQFKIDTPRQYALGDFIASDYIFPVNQKLLPFIFRNPNSDFLKRVFKALIRKGWFNEKWLYITDFNFNPTMINGNSNCYIDGYWHSERYFIEIRSVILHEFELKKTSDRYIELSTKMRNKSSIAIHVRHGDFLLNPYAKVFNVVCSPEYYHQAVTLIVPQVKNPYFYVFTDDINWAVDFFPTINLPFEIISGKGFTDQEELNLMSACQHQIIANSSFSWWGAWLNSNPEKIVISPRKWRNTENSFMSITDLLPANWIKL